MSLQADLDVACGEIVEVHHVVRRTAKEQRQLHRLRHGVELGASLDPGQEQHVDARGSLEHLTGEMFKQMAGVEMQHIPYKGGGPALNDVIGGQVPVFCGSVASTKQYVETGKLNALAVTGKKRASSMPNVPTMAEAGVSGYEVYEWNGIFAPAATPVVILVKIADAITKVMQSSEVKDKVLSLGGEPFLGNADAADKFIKTQMAEWSKLIKTGKITVD